MEISGKYCLVDSSSVSNEIHSYEESRYDECMIGVRLAQEISYSPSSDKDASNFHQ